MSPTPSPTVMPKNASAAPAVSSETPTLVAGAANARWARALGLGAGWR